MVENIEIKEPICMICKHQEGHPWPFCKAFVPLEIPKEIQDGDNGHDELWPKSEEYPDGDNGLQFEPV